MPHFPALGRTPLAGYTTRVWRPTPDAAWRDDLTFRAESGIDHSPGFNALLADLVPRGMRTAIQRQAHTTNITVLEDPFVPDHTFGPATFRVPHNDAMITALEGVLLCSQSADCCVGLVVAGPAIGIFHAGWRGAVSLLPLKVIARLGERFGVPPSECLVALGPTIQQASYQVGTEVIESVRAIEETLGDTSGLLRPDPADSQRAYFDLPGLVIAQLQLAGVPTANIAATAHDTYAEPALFHSYRRDGAGQGLQIGFIGWPSPSFRPAA